MNTRRYVLNAALLFGVAGSLTLGLAGCASDPSRGYSFGGVYDKGIVTVGVPVFENRTFSNGIEVMLTDALVKEIQRRTPWVVAQPEDSDATLGGIVRRAEIRELQQSTQTGTTLEAAFILEVDFTLRDNRTGRTRVSRERFASAGSFVPNSAYGERLAVGERDAVQRLARDIVGELRSDW